MKIENGELEMKIGSRGAGLLELLLALAVFASLLPFAYRFAANAKEKTENAIIIRKIDLARSALERYIIDHRQKLLEPVSGNVSRVKISDLHDAGVDDLDPSKFELRIVKSKDSGGRSFVQGVVIYDSKSISPLRTRQIALAGGHSAGFADGRMLYGSFGTWQMPVAALEFAGGHSILAQTRPLRNGGDYLQRLPSESALDATMQSDLDMGGHDIAGVGTVSAESVRFLDRLYADSVEASKMTVSNRLDWSAPLIVFGDVQVLGPIASDGKSLDASSVSVSGRSQFRSVAAEELRIDNLYLSGFSVGGENGVPAVLSIAGTLDMTRGHVQALAAFVGFSGSVAPRLIVSDRIEDASNSAFHWDVAGEKATLGDMMLALLPPVMRSAYNFERTGKTETERLMSQPVQNSNATAADYLRALEGIRRTVEEKYREVINYKL